MRLPKLLIVIALLVCLPAFAFAHSGETDSNGGHTDHSTGEYHYHHGYSAHHHYDIDGDGYRDCPYDFDDKTGSSSSGTSQNSSKWGSSFGSFLDTCLVLGCLFGLFHLFYWKPWR